MRCASSYRGSAVCIEKMGLFRRWTKKATADNSSVEADGISVQVVRMSSQTTVVVAGRVTVDSSLHLRSVLLRLLRTGSGPVIPIDVSKVSYLDTSGIATLMEALIESYLQGSTYEH